MGEPTMMFCVGATKAGTSWLHRYISNHKECHMRAIKELHYFDAVEFDDWQPWIDMVDGRRKLSLLEAQGLEADQAERKLSTAQGAADWLKVLKGRRQNDAAYLQYMTDGMSEETLIGDFTPAYSLLPEGRLRHMASILPRVRFVYLLRDPVERIWSHCRMMAKRRANKPDEVQRRSVNIMKRVLKEKEAEIVRRSDYASALKRLEAVTGQDQLFVSFYEDLFNRETIAKLSRFLGIGLGWADYDKRFLEGPKAQMEPGQWAEMREFLAHQYDAMSEMLGDVPASWGKEPAKV